MDVVSADLARLVRHPNTRHFGVEYTDEPRCCVPVSVKESTKINVDLYEMLTKQPRPVPEGCRRNPSEEAGGKVIQAIRTASYDDVDDSVEFSAPSKRSSQRVLDHEQEAKDVGMGDLKAPIKNTNSNAHL